MQKRSGWDEPDGDFEQRVRVFAAVIDQEDEIELIMAMAERNGWRIRQCRRRSAPADGVQTTGLLIDIWLNGDWRSAVAEATRRVEDLAERKKLGLWVRDAALVDYPKANLQRYVVSQAPQRSGRSAFLGIGQSLVAMTGSRRLIQVAEGTPDAVVQAELERYDLGQPFDPERHSFRSVRNLAQPSSGAKAWLLSAAGLLVIAICGNEIPRTSGFWWLLPLLSAIIVSLLWIRNAHPARAAGWCYCGFLVTAIGTAGALIGKYYGSSLKFLGGICLVSIGLFIARGVWFAMRNSWFIRNAVWTVPLTITLLAPKVPWLGGLILEEYLGQFGISASAVAVSTIWKILAAAGPILVSAAVIFVFFGIVGWARYFHLIDRYNRALIAIASACAVLIYVLFSLQLGISRADSAAAHAMVAARDGRNPASYYGLQGILVCLGPIRVPIPVLFGPLPATRPVLSFAPTGNRLWAWDPGSIAAQNQSAHAISVQLQNVIVTQAVGQPATCPSNASESQGKSKSG
jgi:hypothetical protein